MLLPKLIRKQMNPSSRATREYLTSLVDAGDVAALERMQAQAKHWQTRQLLRLAAVHAERKQS